MSNSQQIADAISELQNLIAISKAVTVGVVVVLAFWAVWYMWVAIRVARSTRPEDEE